MSASSILAAPTEAQVARSKSFSSSSVSIGLIHRADFFGVDRRDILGIGALVDSLPIVGPALKPLMDALGFTTDAGSQSLIAVDPDQLSEIHEAIAQASSVLIAGLPNITLPIQPPVAVTGSAGVLPTAGSRWIR